MEQELISIIIPVYNVEIFLRKCLNSIKKQTYKNIEVILVDDGSVDKSPQICDEYAKKDARFKVIHKSNGGAASARTAGLDFIMNRSGDYVIFVDADDWLPRDAVETLVHKQKETDADLVCGSCTIIYPIRNIKSRFTEDFFLKKENEKFQKFMSGRIQAPWAKLYRNAIIAENNLRFDCTMKAAEDALFNYKYIQCCEKFASTESIVYYRNLLNKNSLVHTFIPERNLYHKINLTERRKCFKNGAAPDKAFEDRFVLITFNMLVINYIRFLPRDAAIEKIRETHELFFELMNNITVEDSPNNKSLAASIYLECGPLLKSGQYSRVYDYFYSYAAIDSSLSAKVKNGITSVMERIRLFILFRRLFS